MTGELLFQNRENSYTNILPCNAGFMFSSYVPYIMVNQDDWSRVMRKPEFCLCVNKGGADQLCSNCTVVFATRRVQFLLYFRF